MIVNNIDYAIKPFLIHVPGLRLSNEGNTAMRSSAEAYLRGSTDVSIMLFFSKAPLHSRSIELPAIGDFM